MKKLMTSILLILIMISTATAQYEKQSEPICIEGLSRETYSGQLGGYILPSEGTVNVFIVFVQFPDDSYDINNPYWVKGQAPQNMNSWVNQSWSSNPIQGSMTHYFNEMSFNKLKFTGKTASVITPHSRQWYLDNIKRRGDIHKEVIQQLDQTWDFAQFDNWDLVTTYNHSNQSDGIVELIIMVWRNIGNEFSGTYKTQVYSNLNFEYSFGTLGGSSFTVDNGARTIKTNFYPTPYPIYDTPGGSGVTITDHLLQKNLVTPIHEFAHYLMGGNEYHVGYGFWGMLEAWGKKSKVANSFERYRLGWINVNEVNNSPNQTISNATLSDYVTTGVSYRLNINSASNEYFYIENHQKNSYWENTHTFGTYGNGHVFGTIENGLYILRQDGYVGNNVQIIPADGRYSWMVNQLIANPWGTGDLPVFKNLGADRVNGYHDLNLIPWTWNGVNQTSQAIHFTENANGQPILDVRYPGDGKDAFRQSHNEIFSPWSNPNSHKANRTATPFGFKINNLINGVYTVDIYVNTAINAPPSKPQDLRVTVHDTGDNTYPKLNWDLNIEPDVISATQAYLIERSLNGGAFTQIAAVNGSTSQYIDYGLSYAGSGPNTAVYKIRAKDTQGLTSLYTEGIGIAWGDAWKIGTNAIEVVKEYKLQQNYPNPFNPMTSINYQIKEKGLVSLKVFDMLGKEVAELVNETKDKGHYAIMFDASNLPSGVYIYSLRVNDYVRNNKMTLLK